MSVAPVKPPAPTPAPNILTQTSGGPARTRGADGDTAAQESLETHSTNQSERANGGFAPKPNTANKVDKTA
jgi:hypothetical protein